MKTTSLSLVFGSGLQMMAKQLDAPVQEAARFKKQFLDAFPEVGETVPFFTFAQVTGFFSQTVTKAAADGVVRTIAGRIRSAEGLRSSDLTARAEAERQATNTKIQGSASDVVCTLLALCSSAFR
eukprot:Polyplicarium_translucidae@DN3248_c0_g1_i16.p1